MMLNIEEHDTSADAMVVNRDAVFQLMCATYDNHHTREIAADGGDIYLACKSQDVFGSSNGQKTLSRIDLRAGGNLCLLLVQTHPTPGTLACMQGKSHLRHGID